MDTFARNSLLSLLMFLLLPLGSNAWAIENGLALWGGINSLDIKEFDLDSTRGATIGGDYQLVLGEKYSLNPFIMRSTNAPNYNAGSTNIELDITTTSLGVEGRLWARDLFNLSLRLASYSVEVAASGGAAQTKSGTGYGIGQGIETNTGLLVQARYDQVIINGDSYSWLRLLAGWRF